MLFRLFSINAHLAKHAVKSLTGVSSGNYSHLLYPNLIQQCSRRPNTFFTKLPAEQLWKSVTSVSNAGRRRGRGKRGTKKLAINLNYGKQIGVGKVRMVWPGLNTPVVQGQQLVSLRRSEDSVLDQIGSERSAAPVGPPRIRNTRTLKVHPLERGWTSAHMGGRSIGPPDPVKDKTFENFDTKVLEFKIVNCMTNNMGRRRRYSCFAVTGNKNGLAGFALKKSSDTKGCITNVKNRAGQNLMYIHRYNNHTVYHDFFTQFGRTKIFVKKKPEGYGLVGHRALKECCKLIGIKDLYVKIEGAINVQNAVKAFFLGLINQKTHQELAEEKKLHLVEFRKENNNYPKVVASPSQVRTKEEIGADEIIDFTQHVMGGKVMLEKKKPDPFFYKLDSWTLKKRKMEYRRNQEGVRLRMYMEHGKLRSFLSDKYPEAVPHFWKKRVVVREKEEWEE